MADKKDKDNLTTSGASLSPKRPPVDIKDEVAIQLEFRRLKKKINRLHNELHLAHYSIKVFKKLFFEAPEYEEVRKLVLSFADEYAIIKNEHEDIERAEKIDREYEKKKLKEMIYKFELVGGDVDAARKIFAETFGGEEKGTKAYTYWSVESEFIKKLDLSPETLAILRAFDNWEYNNNRKHTRSERRHLFPEDWQDSADYSEDDDNSEQGIENLPDNSTLPIRLIIKEAREECERITLAYHEKHLAEIKTILDKAVAERAMTRKQANRYFQYHYEHLRVVDISNVEGGTKPASISESLYAAEQNIITNGISLSPSKELYDDFWKEINPWKEKILLYNGGLR